MGIACVFHSIYNGARLKKMNIDLPAEELEMDSTPGTPMERDYHTGGLAENLRKRLTPLGTPIRSQPSSLANSQVIYGESQSPPPATSSSDGR